MESVLFPGAFEFMSTVDAQFQIIVTEHAGSITWQGISHTRSSETAEGSREFLIPEEWKTLKS